MIFKTKYIVIIVQKVNNSYDVLKTIRINANTDKITYDTKTIELNTENYSYRKNLKRYYLVDINSKQIVFFPNQPNESAKNEIKNLIMKKEIIKQFVSGISQSTKRKVYDMLLGIVIGGLSGFLIAYFLLKGGI